MSVSEHANYLLNEYGRLQFDYAAYCKPYGESLRNEARNNLETYIAELEVENERLQDAWFVDETICPDGSLRPKVSTLLDRIAALKGVIEILEDRQREVKKLLIDKNRNIDSLYGESFKLRQRIAELEAFVDQLIGVGEMIAECSEYESARIEWEALVDNWKEREE